MPRFTESPLSLVASSGDKTTTHPQAILPVVLDLAAATESSKSSGLDTRKGKDAHEATEPCTEPTDTALSSKPSPLRAIKEAIEGPEDPANFAASGSIFSPQSPPEAELDPSPLPRVSPNAAPVLIKLEKRGPTAQLEFWHTCGHWRDTMVAKLNSIGREDLAQPLAHCRTEQYIAMCTRCEATRIFWNRCERFCCPLCQPRLARERRDQIEWWALTIKQPKHVVLTAPNTTTLTVPYLQWLKRAWTALRRSSLAANWQGGFWTIEVTNKGNGWHVHIHAIIDARWIPADQLARAWAQRLGTPIAIVDVSDARDARYLAEAVKYVCKMSDLVTLPAEDLATVIDTFSRQRTFGVFGSLYGQRTAWRDYLATQDAATPTCECGCTRWRVFTPDEFEAWSILTEPRHHPRPPPKIEPQLDFDLPRDAVQQFR